MDMNDLFGDYQNGNYSAPQSSTPMQENNFNSYANGGAKSNKKTKAPKAKKGGFSFILVLLLIIAIAGGGFYVYAYTDVFKTPKELMGKYLLNMIEVANNATPISKQIAEKTTGTSSVDGVFKVPAAVQMGIEGIDVDLLADYDNEMAELKIGTEIVGQTIDMTVIANKDEFAVGSSLVDLSTEYNTQYVGVKNENLKNFAKIFELDSEIVDFIPNKINFDAMENLFTKEELADIKKRYFEILNTKLTDEMFSVENNVETKVNGTAYQAKKVSLNVSTTTLVEIAYDLLTELRDDRVILDSYKKIIDVELPKDDFDKAIDEMLTELEDVKELETESPSGSMVVNTYINKGKAIKVEAIMFDDEVKVLQEMNYAVVETDKGYLCVSEAFSPEGTYSPSQTQTTLLDIECSATNQKIVGTVKLEYGEVLQNDDFYSSFNEYEDESLEYVYEIKNFSEKGYSDSLTYEMNGEKMFEFSSNVKFDEKVKVTDIDNSNTLFINDLSRQEFNELIGVIALAITGEDITEDDSDDLFQSSEITDDPFADMDTEYEDNLYSNTITDDYVEDDTVENTVLPELVVREDEEDPMDVLSDELTSAVDICKKEAEKNDYGVKDYLIAENLKSLCPSIDIVEQIDSGVDTEVHFNITDTDGNTYLYRVFVDEFNPDVVNGDSISLS